MKIRTPKIVKECFVALSPVGRRDEGPGPTLADWLDSARPSPSPEPILPPAQITNETVLDKKNVGFNSVVCKQTDVAELAKSAASSPVPSLKTLFDCPLLGPRVTIPDETRSQLDRGDRNSPPFTRDDRQVAPVEFIAAKRPRTSALPETNSSSPNNNLEEARLELADLVSECPPSAEAFGHLESQLELWTCRVSGSQRAARGPRPNRYSRQAQQRAKINQLNGRRDCRSRVAKNVRAAFWRNQKETVRQIIEDDSGSLRCEIPASVIEQSFRTDAAARHSVNRQPLPPWMAHCSYEGTNSQLDLGDNPITASEVMQVLSDLKTGSAPGPDGLTYSFWKGLDPKGEILSKLFEICRHFRRVPLTWRHSRVILIPKDRDGDLQDVGNWRPIALSRTLYKIYASVIARRLQRWAVQGNVISPEQKGFVPAEGVHEHVFMLDAMLADAKFNRKNIYLAWLDIRNAFGTVRLGSVLETV